MKKICLVAIVMMVGIASVVFSGCDFHTHTVMESAAVEPTCTVDGLTEGSYCSECNEVIAPQKVIPALGHVFGEWVVEEEKQYRICSRCGYRETQFFGDRPNEGESDVVYGSYLNFDLFKDDCIEDGKTLAYNGAHNRLEVNLRGGTYRCDGYAISIPQRITSLRVIGDTKGDPYADFKILIESRTSDLDVYFENVLIESNNSIFVSETRNINVNITVAGEKCSFLVISKAANGATGNEAGLAGNGNSGKPGADGVSAFIVNGNCTIDVGAKILEIQGGEGGNGGRGSNAKSFGSGGKGGNGGNGGNGILGDNLAQVVVRSADSDVSIVGGKGGAAGKGGSGTLGYSSGKSGSAGKDGASGCDIVYSSDESF